MFQGAGTLTDTKPPIETNERIETPNNIDATILKIINFISTQYPLYISFN